LFTTTSYALGLIVAPLFVLIFYTIDRPGPAVRLQTPFRFFVQLSETLRKLAAEMNNYIDLEKIVDLIVDTIKKTMFLNRPEYYWSIRLPNRPVIKSSKSSALTRKWNISGPGQFLNSASGQNKKNL
jgi:hypothetical protein